MENSIRAIAVVITGAFAAPTFAAECVVSDPTGTPLNVRAEPQGMVLTALGNGTSVEIVGKQTLKGKRWARVAVNGRTLGWVFTNYLDCTVADDSRKSAPMRPRMAPQ